MPDKAYGLFNQEILHSHLYGMHTMVLSYTIPTENAIVAKLFLTSVDFNCILSSISLDIFFIFPDIHTHMAGIFGTVMPLRSLCYIVCLSIPTL